MAAVDYVTAEALAQMDARVTALEGAPSPSPPASVRERTITLGTSPQANGRADFEAEIARFAPAPLTQAMYFSQVAADPIIFSGQVADTAALGMTPHVTWSGAPLSVLAEAGHDAQWQTIQWRLDAMKGRALWVRLNHEFNNTRDTSYGVGKESPEQFVAGWRYVAGRLRAMSPHVRLVWCPNFWIDPGSDGTWADPLAYYPGDEWVDAVGLDGYMSNNRPNIRSFAQLFQPSYDALVALAPSKPVWIAEVGCTTQRNGVDQAAWIADMWTTIGASMPQVDTVNWWQRGDYRLSPAGVEAFKAGYAETTQPRAAAAAAAPAAAEPVTLVVAQGAGTPDATSALQGSIDRAVAAGVDLYVPAGTYAVSAPLVARSSALRIYGAGSTKTLIKATHAGDVLTIGPGSLVTLNPTVVVERVSIEGPRLATSTTGKACLVLSGAVMAHVRDVQVGAHDIGIDARSNCMGFNFTNVRAGFGGSLRVGVNLRKGNDSGSDTVMHNCWVAGTIAAVHVSGGGGGYHVYGTQFSGGMATKAKNDDAAAVIVGKDYTSGATGEASIDLTDVSFEGTNYAWCVRTFDGCRVNLDRVAFSAQDSRAPALGAIKMTNAKNSTVNISGHAIAGHYSEPKMIVVEGAWADTHINESGGYCAADNPTVAGVKGYFGSLVEKSKPSCQWYSQRGASIVTNKGRLL